MHSEDKSNITYTTLFNMIFLKCLIRVNIYIFFFTILEHSNRKL